MLCFLGSGSDAASFENSYRKIGQKLGIPGLEDDKANMKQLVLAALEGVPGPWILIVDNADDYEMFSKVDDRIKSRALIEYLPNCSNGAVLFTTRDNKAATTFAEANVIRVKRDEQAGFDRTSHQKHTGPKA